MKIVILPHTSSSIFSFIVDLLEINNAHGKIDMQRSMVWASNKDTAFFIFNPGSSHEYRERAILIRA
jgi:hypothetical protein